MWPPASRTYHRPSPGSAGSLCSRPPGGRPAWSPATRPCLGARTTRRRADVHPFGGWNECPTQVLVEDRLLVRLERPRLQLVQLAAARLGRGSSFGSSRVASLTDGSTR